MISITSGPVNHHHLLLILLLILFPILFRLRLLLLLVVAETAPVIDGLAMIVCVRAFDTSNRIPLLFVCIVGLKRANDPRSVAATGASAFASAALLALSMDQRFSNYCQRYIRP